MKEYFVQEAGQPTFSFTYTPEQKSAELKVVRNIPSINREEVLLSAMLLFMLLLLQRWWTRRRESSWRTRRRPRRIRRGRDGSPARGQLSEKERRGSIGGKDESWLGEQIQQEEGHEEVVGGREAWKGGDNQEQGKGEDGVDLQVLLHQLAGGGEDPEEGEVSGEEEKEKRIL